MRHTFTAVAAAFAAFADRTIVSEIKKISGPPIRTGDTVILHEIDSEETYNYSGREMELPIVNADNTNKGLKMGFVLLTYGLPTVHEAQLQNQAGDADAPPEVETPAAATRRTRGTAAKKEDAI